MIRAPLESELEKSILKIGIKLGDREYAEDINLAAQIDDIEHPIKSKTPEEEILQDIFLASDYQRNRNQDIIFRRRTVKNKLGIEYLIVTENPGEQIKEAKPMIDEIISNKKYGYENLNISRRDDLNDGSWIYLPLLHVYVFPNGVIDASFNEDTSQLKRGIGANLPLYLEKLKKIKLKFDHKKMPVDLLARDMTYLIDLFSNL